MSADWTKEAAAMDAPALFHREERVSGGEKAWYAWMVKKVALSPSWNGTMKRRAK